MCNHGLSNYYSVCFFCVLLFVRVLCLTAFSAPNSIIYMSPFFLPKISWNFLLFLVLKLFRILKDWHRPASPGFGACLAILNISKYPRQVTLLDEPVAVYVCEISHLSLSHWRDITPKFRTGVTTVSALLGCSTETISFCVEKSADGYNQPRSAAAPSGRLTAVDPISGDTSPAAAELIRTKPVIRNLSWRGGRYRHYFTLKILNFQVQCIL